MKLAVRILLISIAIPAIAYLHILLIWFAVALAGENRNLEWPIMGLGLLSFVTTVTFAIALTFRDKKQ